MAAEQRPNRLPFEPSKKRQKPSKNSQKPQANKQNSEQPQQSTKPKEPPLATTNNKSGDRQQSTKVEAVPKVVSDRMARRMSVFCGLPTFLGMGTFVVNYLAINQGWFKIPNVAVLLSSIGFFGLGVIGLSYGVISASWDEDLVGSRFGWQEFKTNFGRIISAWRSAQQKNT